MKPYGLQVIEHPDVSDIRQMACKSSTGGKNYGRNTYDKARTRRRWKRLARKLAKAEVCQQVNE